MNEMLENLLKSIDMDVSGIYRGLLLPTQNQAVEVEMRGKFATREYGDYFDEISKYHSIPVMDREVDIFLASIPKSGLVLDIGGCWGWHWRRLARNRPDVGVLIIDFVHSNLLHAQSLLGELVGNQVALMHADATALPFRIDSKFQGFDGVWTVQTFQHIPAYDKAVAEAHRVLKRGGLFSNYSLNIQAHMKSIFGIFRKKYVVSGWIEGNFWLARASVEQKKLIEAIFDNKVRERWSEIIYSPELRMPASGQVDSLLGKLDACLSNDVGFLRCFARQHSFHCRKS